jgi:hypothetical protein
MEKQLYNQMISQQQSIRDHYWVWIFESWSSPKWIRVPTEIQKGLGLPSGIGVCSGMLMSQASAEGVSEFVQRMNRARSM